MDKVLFPTNISNNHWVLIAFFVQEYKLQYYDSMIVCDPLGKQRAKHLKLVKSFLNTIANINGSKYFLKKKTLSFCEAESTIIQQPNGVDCGVRVLMAAQLLLENKSVQQGLISLTTTNYRDLIFEELERNSVAVQA